MEYHSTPLNYGGDEIDAFIPKSLEDVTTLQVAEYKSDFTDFAQKLNDVLDSPVGSKPFNDLVNDVYEEGNRVLFMVDDKTRPNIHTKKLLPIVANRLMSIGVRKQDIGIIISSGSHVPASPQEVEDRILGQELYSEWGTNVLTHDCDSGNTHVGETSRGTPILIDQQVLDSSLLIPLSDSEYHYFAGQAGTVKLFCPGVAGRETIRVNHPRMFDLEKGFD
ncbi:MAG: lactate racemase domain-containing protein, partial [Candidatus Thorarchaeota archaeon]